MARSLTAGMVTEITATVLKPFIAVEIVFDTDTTRVWSGVGTVTIGGEIYYGVGTFGSIGPINETTENKAAGVELQLSGIPPEMIATALGENYQGNACSIYLGALDEDHTVIVDPYKIFSGKIDTMNIGEAADSATIRLTAESRMIDMTRSRIRRYTPEDQRVDYPSDKGLDYVSSLQETQVKWGA